MVVVSEVMAVVVEVTGAVVGELVAAVGTVVDGPFTAPCTSDKWLLCGMVVDPLSTEAGFESMVETGVANETAVARETDIRGHTYTERMTERVREREREGKEI